MDGTADLQGLLQVRSGFVVVPTPQHHETQRIQRLRDIWVLTGAVELPLYFKGVLQVRKRSVEVATSHFQKAQLPQSPRLLGVSLRAAVRGHALERALQVLLRRLQSEPLPAEGAQLARRLVDVAGAQRLLHFQGLLQRALRHAQVPDLTENEPELVQASGHLSRWSFTQQLLRQVQALLQILPGRREVAPLAADHAEVVQRRRDAEGSYADRPAEADELLLELLPSHDQLPSFCLQGLEVRIFHVVYQFRLRQASQHGCNGFSFGMEGAIGTIVNAECTNSRRPVSKDMDHSTLGSQAHHGTGHHVDRGQGGVVPHAHAAPGFRRVRQALEPHGALHAEAQGREQHADAVLRAAAQQPVGVVRGPPVGGSVLGELVEQLLELGAPSVDPSHALRHPSTVAHVRVWRKLLQLRIRREYDASPAGGRGDELEGPLRHALGVRHTPRPRLLLDVGLGALGLHLAHDELAAPGGDHRPSRVRRRRSDRLAACGREGLHRNLPQDVHGKTDAAMVPRVEIAVPSKVRLRDYLIYARHGYTSRAAQQA
mmetsp:Transcript_70382/g.198551  ORF Transcript_70382/g.198551 Transcript_70382/m.198551 type:complete len:543 (+) Transcript_70382:433-2061(+)